MPLQHPQNAIILQNEQPIYGCKDCEIFWYNLVDRRNQWKKRPTETSLQNLFETAQNAYLEHWQTHQTQEEEEIVFPGAIPYGKKHRHEHE